MNQHDSGARPRVDGRTEAGSRPWIVKIGGSLACSENLKRWLHAVAAVDLRIVIVPGGGPFAEQVRNAQKVWGFDDRAAHAMALLAMEQYGRLMQALEPTLALGATVAELERALDTSRPAVWLPQAMVLGNPGIEESWEVTSDSLAAWLAGTLRARGLVLVKSAELPTVDSSADELCRAGIVDAALGRFLGQAEVDAWCVRADRCAETLNSLGTRRGPGIAVVGGRRGPS